MANFTFHYYASAVGLGGVLKYEKSGVTIARSLASVALAPTGGEGYTESAGHDSDGISFSRATSHVTGYDSGYRTFTTKSDLYMEDLNLFDRVKAASLQLNITSTREVLPTATLKTENPDTALFSMSTMIVGLTIDGVEITPEFDLDLCQCATYAAFAAQINRDSDAYARQFGVPTAHLRTVLAANPLPIRGSLVKNLGYTPTPTVGPPQGFRIQVKNFGVVHIGELIVKAGTRTANLLRIDFNAKQKVDQPAQAATGRRNAEISALSRDGEAAISTAKSPDSGTGTILSLTGNGAPNWP